MLFFDGEDKANIYEHPAYNPNTPENFEEALAESRGGDSTEWIPEAGKIRKDMADAIAAGGNVAMVSSEPETEGVFAGYYAVKIPLIKRTEEDVELVVRTVYATFEQVAMGHFTAPKEGLFCVDPDNSH